MNILDKKLRLGKLILSSIFIFFITKICAQDLQVDGKIQGNSITLLDGAAQNKVLVSDSKGNGSWSDLPAKKRSIVITPSMLQTSFFTAGIHDKVGLHPCVIYPESTSSGNAVSVPLPANYKGPLSIRIQYTSSTTVGNFHLVVATNGPAIGEDLDTAAYGGSNLLLPPPNMVDHLAEVVKKDIASVDAQSRVMTLVLYRDPTSYLDTSTGELKIVGILVEHED